MWKPPSQRAEIDPQWDDIVSHAMQSDPKDRYQKASEIKTDVSHITPRSAEKPWQWVTGEPVAYEKWQGGDLEAKIAGSKDRNYPYGIAYSLRTGGAFGWNFVSAPLSNRVAGFLVEWEAGEGAPGGR